MTAPLKVLVVPSLLASRPSAYLTHLEAAGLEVLRSPLGRPYGEAELIEGLRGVFATVAGIEPYTERVLREAPDLEVIARFGVGYDQIDVPAATRHGVYVAMAFGANHETVADLALGLMGAVARNIVTYHQRVVAGGWGWEFRQGLWRATVGIVGLGRIGRAVARRCRAYEMRVLAHDVAPDRGVRAEPRHRAHVARAAARRVRLRHAARASSSRDRRADQRRAPPAHEADRRT